MHNNALAGTIGEKVRLGRARLGLTRKQLAAKAEVSERYLNELETGAANASIGILVKVAEALEQTPISLLMDASLTPSASFPERRQAGFEAVITGMSMAEQTAALPMLEAWLADRRRASKGVALVGLRGAGKSTFGRMLADRFRVPLISITREVERRGGMSIADLFNLGGPEAYRTLENDVLAEVLARDGRMVLETAGGITGNSDALDTILAHYKTIWLKALPEDHLARVARQGDRRPMQGHPKALDHLRVLLATREADYARAEITIETSGRSIDACFADLVRLTSGILMPA